MSDKDRDKDKDETVLAELYAELSREQPSAALDKKILHTAHKAVSPARASGPFSASWMIPASMAAVVILSVIVVTLVDKKEYSPEINFPEPVGGLKEKMTGNQSSKRPDSDAKTALAKSKPGQSTDSFMDSDDAKERSVIQGETVSSEGDDSGLAQDTREKKKEAKIATRPVAPSAPEKKSAKPAEREAQHLALSIDNARNRISQSVQEEREDASSFQQGQNLQGIAANTALNQPKVGDQHTSKRSSGKVESGTSQGALETIQEPPGDALEAKPVVEQPRVMAGKSNSDASTIACEQLTELDCLKSPQCTLQLIEKESKYQCRTADNNCEKGFRQSVDHKTTCEVTGECVYLPAKCYCAPNEDCQCSGGRPAMCTPTQKETIR